MIEDKINDILKTWNPLDVPAFIAKDEYKDYIPDILNCMVDKKKLESFLLDLLENKMGLIIKDIEEISEITEKIMDIETF
ncbi:MAG: hypothetical protein J5505_08375 [Spirochaetaceae bacterium]|nr:hypothetical protein [Spirochaetaceae bacterium]